MKLVQKHNIARNDPFFAVEVFENLIEFHSIGLLTTTFTYELPIEERLIIFADAFDAKDFEETRAFYLVVEKEGKLWLRKVVMSLDKLIGEEELKPEDLYSFKKPAEAIDQAVFLNEKLYLKSETQILIANEGVVELPKGLKLKSNLVFSSNSTYGGLRCLGELDGVTHDVNVLERKVTPDPNATAIGLFRGDVLLKVYPAALHYEFEDKGYLDKKLTTRLTKGLHNCTIGFRDLFQDGVQSLNSWTPDYPPESYSEETIVVGTEVPSYTYTSQHLNEGSLLMVTPFSRFSKYLEIKRSLKD